MSMASLPSALGSLGRRSALRLCRPMSHTAHRLQTVLTPAQETVVVTCGAPCCCLWMTCWQSRSSSAPMSHARVWTDACAAMERTTSTPSSPGTCGSASDLQSYGPGCVHMDVKVPAQMQDPIATALPVRESSRRQGPRAGHSCEFKANKDGSQCQDAFSKHFTGPANPRINKLVTDSSRVHRPTVCQPERRQWPP